MRPTIPEGQPHPEKCGLFVLALECIGDDAVDAIRQLGALGGGAAGMVPWVARITGRCPKFGLSRQFERGQKDYSEANSVGSRGVYAHYWLRDGIYEVFEMTSWRGRKRYFLRVIGGTGEEITREEVERCLN